MFDFTHEELGLEKPEVTETDQGFKGDFILPDGTRVKGEDSKWLFEARPSLGTQIKEALQIQTASTKSYSSTSTAVPQRQYRNNEEAEAAMKSHVGGWAVGLVLGIIAFRIVRPKAKSRTPIEMARRGMSWGLMGGMTTGITHFFRYGGAEGIAGGLLGICFFSGAAWVLGFIFGLIKFSLVPKIFSKPPAFPAVKPAEIPALREAAGSGDASAQFQLGMAYFAGEGVVKNHIEAYKWILLAQAGGHADAKKMSAQIEKTLSRQELAEGQKLATEMQGNNP
jgi:hypothetical protein